MNNDKFWVISSSMMTDKFLYFSVHLKVQNPRTMSTKAIVYLSTITGSSWDTIKVYCQASRWRMRRGANWTRNETMLWWSGVECRLHHTARVVRYVVMPILWVANSKLGREAIFLGRDITRGNVQKMYIFHKVRTCPKTIVGLLMVANPTLYIPTPAWMRARNMLFIPIV